MRPVAGVGQPLHQPAALQPVDQLGHVGPGHAELVAQGVEARAPVVAAAEHLQHLELGVREAEAAGVPVELAARRAHATRSRASVASRASSARSAPARSFPGSSSGTVPPSRTRAVKAAGAARLSGCDRPPGAGAPGGARHGPGAVARARSTGDKLARQAVDDVSQAGRRRPGHRPPQRAGRLARRAHPRARPPARRGPDHRGGVRRPRRPSSWRRADERRREGWARRSGLELVLR